jgi:hypothetical protein
MGSEDREQQERRLDDERCVDALLAEGGFPYDAELRDVLLQLRSLRVAAVPEPSAELAALLGEPLPADVVRLDEWSRKRPRKKRIVFTTLAVAASLGVAGGAAAANDTLRRQAEGTISSIVNSFSPQAPVAPTPVPPPAAPAVPPGDVPSPAWIQPFDTFPAGPSPVEIPTSEPFEGQRPDKSEPAGRQAEAPAQGPHDAAAPSAVPQTGGKPAEPGASADTGAPSHTGQPPAGRADPGNGGKEKDSAGSNGSPR